MLARVVHAGLVVCYTQAPTLEGNSCWPFSECWPSRCSGRHDVSAGFGVQRRLQVAMKLLRSSDFWWGVAAGMLGSLAVELVFIYLS
jgi:hypothetical protein